MATALRCAAGPGSRICAWCAGGLSGWKQWAVLELVAFSDLLLFYAGFNKRFLTYFIAGWPEQLLKEGTKT